MTRRQREMVAEARAKEAAARAYREALERELGRPQGENAPETKPRRARRMPPKLELTDTDRAAADAALARAGLKVG